MRYYFTLLLFAVLFNSVSFSQDFYNDFKLYLSQDDTAKQIDLLRDWEKANPQDPELYTSYFNYYFNKSKDVVLTVSQKQYGDKALAMYDSTGHIAGYISDKADFDNSDFQKGIDKIDEGICLFPNRLDMRFGKIYALGQIKDWDKFTNEIINTIQYSSENNNQWTWTLNETKENGQDFFVKSLQDYQLQLYNTGDDDLLDYMRQIGLEILKYYPDNVESYSNISVTYLIDKNYEKALEYLHKAEKIAPSDEIIISNIAYGYAQLGDKNKAISYYEKLVDSKDENLKAFAKKQIDLLQE